MKVWVYVEGESDRLALQTLWSNWCEQLRTSGHGIRIIPLDDKSNFFRKIGPRAARQLSENDDDVVVGLPDLYPNEPYTGTRFAHVNVAELERVQRDLVSDALQSVFGVNRSRLDPLLVRFLPSALKHDLEMLLLSARRELRSYLGTPDQLGNWRNPVEDQNQQHPPKRVVEELFRTKSKAKHSYRDTKDASAILRKVTDMKGILYDTSDQIKCPVFKALLDWIGEKTGIPAYR